MTELEAPRVKRPLLHYHGGKFTLAPWIISKFPEHKIYVEPFGGAASVLLRKPPSKIEVYNDLDQDVVELFEILRSDEAEQLIEDVSLTPFAIQEMKSAYAHAECRVERARRFILRSHFGFGSAGNFRPTGFSRSRKPTEQNKATSWDRFPEALRGIVQRLKHVTIENEEACSVMARYDNTATLFYVDPPYVLSTRDPGKDYRFELTDEAHIDLLRFLKALKGNVVLSGFTHDIYREELKGWHTATRKSYTMLGSDRTECLWMNFKPG